MGVYSFGLWEDVFNTALLLRRTSSGLPSIVWGEKAEGVCYSWSLRTESMSTVPEPLITRSPDRLGGTPVFAGTRVPAQTLIDYLEAGDALTDFLEDFPSVSREHAIAVLELAKTALLAQAVAA